MEKIKNKPIEPASIQLFGTNRIQTAFGRKRNESPKLLNKKQIKKRKKS